MTFVFSAWYFVAIALIVGIVVCLTVFFKMDKKDKALIGQFVKDSQSQEDIKRENIEAVVEDENKSE